MIFSCLLALFILSVSALPEVRVNQHKRDQSFTTSVFANPPSTARPKTRYWIKDAFDFDPAVGRYDLLQLKNTGFGGAEVLDFANYHGQTIEDPSYYSIGSGNWSAVFEALVENAVDFGMHLDFCIGAASGGAAVTSFNPRTDPGLETGVVCFHLNLSILFLALTGCHRSTDSNISTPTCLTMAQYQILTLLHLENIQVGYVE